MEKNGQAGNADKASDLGWGMGVQNVEDSPKHTVAWEPDELPDVVQSFGQLVLAASPNKTILFKVCRQSVQMKPMAVFYHAWIPNRDALVIVNEQLAFLELGGLAEAASEVHIGVNEDYATEIVEFAPDKAMIHAYRDQHLGEFPTMTVLQKWLSGHSGWNVCYHHSKGISHGIERKQAARRCMQDGVIMNWRRCVRDLESGADAVGCHWLFHPRDKILPGQRFFGGNFWWASQSYLSQLPPLRPLVHTDGRYYEGESWIGQGKRMPVTRDYHIPGSPCAL